MSMNLRVNLNNMVITLEERWTLDCSFTLFLETGTLWIRLFGMLRLYPFLERRLKMQILK